MHAVSELQWARWQDRSPWGGRAQRRTRAQMAGLSFQKKVTQALKRRIPLQAGPWISFEDRTGRHAAQPDLLLWPDSSSVVLVEAKYTFTPAAWSQLHDLYVPLLSLLWPEKEILPVVLCKKLTPDAPLSSPYIVNLSTLHSKDDFCPQMILVWDTKHPLILH